MTGDKKVGWHHQLGRRELEQASGVGDIQGSLVCSSPWGRKELDMTEGLSLFKLSRRLDSGTLSLRLPVCLSTHTVPFFLLVNTLLVSLLSIFVGILSCKAEGPGSMSSITGLVVRIWCSHHRDLVSITGWGTEALLQVAGG